MSKKENTKNFILNKINEMQFKKFRENYQIIPSHSIKVNENTFALFCFSLENANIKYIIFFSYICDNFILVGQYKINDSLIEKSSDFIQMKVENRNLIIILTKYLIVEEILINGTYEFKNIISLKLNEKPFKILNNNKFVSSNNNYLQIYQFSKISKDFQCLFKISKDILFTHIFDNQFKKNINKKKIIIESYNFETKAYNYDSDKEEEEDEDSLFNFIDVSNQLCDVIEIKEKNLIIISTSKKSNSHDNNNMDCALCKYIISIIDTKSYQIKAKLFGLIEAEKLFYLGNDVLLSYGLRNIFKLNLKNFKIELKISENENGDDSIYYHYNMIPFLNKNKILTFGYLGHGSYFTISEYKHCCLLDMKKNNLKEIDITNTSSNKYDIKYFPLYIKSD